MQTMKKELIRVRQNVDEVWMDIGQYLDESWMNLRAFYLETNLVIQPLSFIAHSFIVHNKRVQDKWLDVPELFLYVVLPDQNL